MLKITLKTDMTDCCDVESSRYALGGMVVEAGQDPIVAATNSRVLAVTRAEGECSELTVVPVSILPKNGDVAKPNFITTVQDEGKTICQSFVSKGKKFSGEPENLAKPSLAASVTSKSGEKLEGRFPRFRDVIPSLEEGDLVVLTIDPQYLAAIHKAITTGDLEENTGLTMVIKTLRPKEITESIKDLKYNIETTQFAIETLTDESAISVMTSNVEAMKKTLESLLKDTVTGTDSAIFCDSNAGIGVVMPMALGDGTTDLEDAARTVKDCIKKRKDFCNTSPPAKTEKEPKTRKERKAKAAKEEATLEDGDSTANDQPAEDNSDDEADPALIELYEKQEAIIQEQAKMIQELLLAT